MVRSNKKHDAAVTNQIYAILNLPTGAVFSPFVGQYATWAICEPLLGREDVTVRTMIDNVAIAADDVDTFYEAVTTFLDRCKKYKAQLNEADKLPTTKEEILKKGLEMAHDTVFLGERYRDHRVCIADKHVEKLKEAFERLERGRRGEELVTKRQVAACIGLMTWCSEILNVQLFQFHVVFKLFRTLELMTRAWDILLSTSRSYPSS